MKIKLILFLIFIVSIVGALGYVFRNHPLVKPWIQRAPQVQLPSNLEQPTRILTENSKKLPSFFSQSSKILGATKESSESGTAKTSLHQQAFETARYNYCQQVVNDYQQRYPDKKTN